MRGEKRAEIVRAAKQEFARLGYAGASTAQIARVAGVAQPLVHHHFGSKLGLWEAMMEELCGEQLAVVMAAAGEPPVTPAARIARCNRMLRALITHYARSPELVRIEMGAAGEAAEILQRRWAHPLYEILLRELQDAAADGVLAPDLQPLHLYFFVQGAVYGPLLNPDTAAQMGFDASDPAAMEAYADAVTRTLLFGVFAR